MAENLRQLYSYSIAATTTSATAARVTPGGCRNVRLAASTNDVYVVIGVSPVATVANGMIIKAAAGYGETFGISSGEQIAVITATGAASLNVTELTH